MNPTKTKRLRPHPQGRPHKASPQRQSDSQTDGHGDAGFYFQIKGRRGITSSEADAFVRRLEDYFLQHQLQMEGGPLRAWVTAQDKSLSPEDCMDFLCWIARDGAVAHVATSGVLKERPELAATVLRISVAVTDSALHAAISLYQSHRLSGRMALAVLDSQAPLQGSSEPSDAMCPSIAPAQ
ncbi:hypothetical protein [Rhodoferax sp. GW822-FHT02A01]|uniref:hypothetical protein n=1 Tax=Rhodoferax sp. GW822-FHT02A01 TaxID=3141537 RepID=UPI00315C672F